MHERVTIINISNGIKEPIYAYQDCNISQILIFGGYVKVGESLYILVVIWVNIILNHIDTRAILPRHKDFSMVSRLKWYQDIFILPYFKKGKERKTPIPYWYQNKNVKSSL